MPPESVHGARSGGGPPQKNKFLLQFAKKLYAALRLTHYEALPCKEARAM